MLINQEKFKQVCATISSAIDASELSQLTNTLELKVVDKQLFLNITNLEYFLAVRIYTPITDEDANFIATVNASIFVKLVSQITTDTIELTVIDNSLILKGNGTYKLPLIYNEDKLLELTPIVINNVTSSMNIDSSILRSILTFNSKQLLTDVAQDLRHKLYYIDDKGAITYQNCACINNFVLEKPIKILLDNKLVKLFKLFESDSVYFELGYDALTDNVVQTKIRIVSNDITLTAILSCDDTLLNSIPVNAIRSLADEIYPYSVNINKDLLLQAINRASILMGIDDKVDKITNILNLTFTADGVEISGNNNQTLEKVPYTFNESLVDCYSVSVKLNHLKLTLESCIEPYITINLGGRPALVIKRLNITNIIPKATTV